MATYFVASGGSNTAPYDTWAKAATSLATALAAATASGDVVVIQHNAIPAADQELAATTTYTLAAQNMQLISASNDGGSAYTPTAMGTSSWIGNSTAARFARLAGGVKAYVYGITFRQADTTSNGTEIGVSSDGVNYELEDCMLWQSGSAAAIATFTIGSVSGNTYIRAKNLKLRFGGTGQQIRLHGHVEFFGGQIDSTGSAPSTLVNLGGNAAQIYLTGFDLSHITGTLFSSAGTVKCVAFFDRCRMGTGYTLLAAQTPANKSSAAVWLFDCAVGDVQGRFQYADAFGTVTSDTAITYTGSPAGQSWKIETTANCSFATPFVTPPIANYHVGTSAITPRLEILRDGSTTAYDNDEVWAEFMAKVTAGTSLATLYQDRMAIGGTPAAQAAGAGLGAWTGESGTAWSGKIDSGSALTPAEAGDISAVVCVGLPSATVYVDPVIRTD